MERSGGDFVPRRSPPPTEAGGGAPPPAGLSPPHARSLLAEGSLPPARLGFAKTQNRRLGPGYAWIQLGRVGYHPTPPTELYPRHAVF